MSSIELQVLLARACCGTLDTAASSPAPELRIPAQAYQRVQPPPEGQVREGGDLRRKYGLQPSAAEARATLVF